MVPMVIGSSVQDQRLVKSGEVEITFTHNNPTVFATKDVGPYSAGAIDVRAIAALNPCVLHKNVLGGSDIKSIQDLKGRHVGVGPADGGTLGFVIVLLPLNDIAMDDFTPQNSSYSDGFRQLTDGNVDAAFAFSRISPGEEGATRWLHR